MQRTDLAYLLVGVATAAERRARAAVETSAHITAAVAAPAVAAFEATPLAAPVRRRAVGIADPLVADGQGGRRTRPADRRTRGRTGHLGRARLPSVGRGRGSRAVERRGPPRRHGRDQPSGDRRTARRRPRRARGGSHHRPGDGQPAARPADHPDAGEQRVSSGAAARDDLARGPLALSQQTAGLAQDVTVGVRARTVTADDTVEQAARSLLRRPRRIQPGLMEHDTLRRARDARARADRRRGRDQRDRADRGRGDRADRLAAGRRRSGDRRRAHRRRRVVRMDGPLLHRLLDRHRPDAGGPVARHPRRVHQRRARSGSCAPACGSS